MDYVVSIDHFITDFPRGHKLTLQSPRETVRLVSRLYLCLRSLFYIIVYLPSNYIVPGQNDYTGFSIRHYSYRRLRFKILQEIILYTDQ